MSMMQLIMICVLLSLSACNNDAETKPKAKKTAVKIDNEVHEVLNYNKSTTIEAPSKVEEINFNVIEDSLEHTFYLQELSVKAAAFREQRKSKYIGLYSNLQNPNDLKYRFADRDYGDLPKDLSTFPVDRSRIITTDMKINAVLDDDINSQIPGIAIAIVDKPLFSPNNKNILLPVFTKIVCEYEGLELQGQTRLPIKCIRAIRPDGVSITLTDAIVADQMGRSGLTGDVDNRTFEIYAGAFIMSGISALAQSGVNQNAPTYPNWRSNSQTVFSNNIGQVTSDVIRKNIDLRPIVYIKAGTRMQVRPRVDIVFKEPILEEQSEALR
jgi:type IV secretory pathway VirB10-like protein